MAVFEMLVQAAPAQLIALQAFTGQTVVVQILGNVCSALESL
jgi:hypothetical protein